MTIIDKKFG